MPVGEAAGTDDSGDEGAVAKAMRRVCSRCEGRDVSEREGVHEDEALRTTSKASSSEPCATGF